MGQSSPATNDRIFGTANSALTIAGGFKVSVNVWMASQATRSLASQNHLQTDSTSISAAFETPEEASRRTRFGSIKTATEICPRE